MGQKLYAINNGRDNFNFEVSTEGDGLQLTSAHYTSQSPGDQKVVIPLGETDVDRLLTSLAVWKASRKTLFDVGDTVYVPERNLAAKVVRVMKDRVLYNAPYHVEFINVGSGDAPRDYFAAESLVLVARKGEL